jgi:hypothetical protein
MPVESGLCHQYANLEISHCHSFNHRAHLGAQKLAVGA